MKASAYLAIPIALLFVAATWPDSGGGGIGFSSVISDGMAPYSAVHKFGSNVDIDTTTDPEDVWSCPNLGAAGLKPYASDSTIYISSDDENDAAINIEVQGLDESGLLQSVDIALGAALASGTTTVQVGDASGWDRVFRVFVDDSTATAGNVYVHLDADAGTDGVPDAPLTDILACIEIAAQQTLMSHYTIPSGKVGYLMQFVVGVSPAGATTEQAQVKFKFRPNGGVWRDGDDLRLVSTGSGILVQPFPIPMKYAALTDFRFNVLSVASNDTGVFANYDIVLVDE